MIAGDCLLVQLVAIGIEGIEAGHAGQAELSRREHRACAQHAAHRDVVKPGLIHNVTASLVDVISAMP